MLRTNSCVSYTNMSAILKPFRSFPRHLKTMATHDGHFQYVFFFSSLRSLSHSLSPYMLYVIPHSSIHFQCDEYMRAVQCTRIDIYSTVSVYSFMGERANTDASVVNIEFYLDSTLSARTCVNRMELVYYIAVNGFLNENGSSYAEFIMENYYFW